MPSWTGILPVAREEELEVDEPGREWICLHELDPGKDD
jgi:hypothetical protein